MTASHDNVAAGARNLLVGCAGVSRGQRLLLIVEPEGNTHYDPALVPVIAGHARDLGARVDILAVPAVTGPEAVPDVVMTAIATADHTIFLNRIGDQLRFAPLPGRGTKTMSYALDLNFLGSEFATTPYAVWEGIQQRLVTQLDNAHSCRIRCPNGTDLSMRLDAGRARQRPGGFTVKNFPVMIVPPLPGNDLDGRLVLAQALTSTYTHAYDDSIVPLPSPLTLTLHHGQITQIDGDPQLVARARAQFERVGGLFGGGTWTVNSWHAGINAFTFFPRPALSDIDRWSCVAFGSPRYAHFHMCGTSPGDICGQIFDPTISFDDAVLWDGGQPGFLTGAEKSSLLVGTPLDIATFERPRDIGVSPQAAAVN